MKTDSPAAAMAAPPGGPPAAPEWVALPPEHLPPPTTAPFYFAIGVTLLFWGFITSLVVLLTGITVLAFALWRWISLISFPTGQHDE